MNSSPSVPQGSRRFHLISNGKSGRGAGGPLSESVAKLCVEYGYEFVNYEISSPSEIEAQTKKAVAAAEADGGLLVAAGGDGTIRSVAQQAQGKKIRFAVIPVGTFNFFARTHRIPEDQEEAIRLALSGQTSPVRLGEINGEVFLINASLGLYAKAIEDRENRTARFGRHRFVVIVSTIVSMLTKHRLLTIQLTTGSTSQRLVTPMVFIGNNALQMRQLALNVEKWMKRDLLAVITVKPLKKWEILRLLFRGVTKTLNREAAVDSFCVDELTINTIRNPQRVALDGEMFEMSSPIRVRSLPGALNLVVPEKVAELTNVPDGKTAVLTSKNEALA